MAARALWLMFVILLMVALVLAVLLSSQQLASVPSKGEEGTSNEHTEQEAQKDERADTEAVVAPKDQQPRNEASKDWVGSGETSWAPEHREQPVYEQPSYEQPNNYGQPTYGEPKNQGTPQ